MKFDFILIIFSGFSFLIFGFLCFRSNYFKYEFKRYGLNNFRKITGFFQFAGGIGLLLGFFVKELMLMSSFGLFTLMFLGVCVRLKINDGFIRTSPAIFYMLINLYIFYIKIQTYN